MEEESIPTESSDDEEDSKLLVGLTVVQDSLKAAFAEQVKLVEARLSAKYEAKLEVERKKTAKWKRLYQEHVQNVAVKQEGEDSCESELDERKPAAVASRSRGRKRKSDSVSDQGNDRMKQARSSSKAASSCQEDDVGSSEREDDERKPAAPKRSDLKSRSEASDQCNGKRKRTRASSRIVQGRSSAAASIKAEQSDTAESAVHFNFNALDTQTQAWIAAIGLQDAYGTRDEGLNLITVDSYSKPSGFQEVFHLTDFLFPANHGEETYHRQLFQRNVRPGITVRAELRKMKEANQNDPIVCWHNKREEWIPPTTVALIGMVRAIVRVGTKQRSRQKKQPIKRQRHTT